MSDIFEEVEEEVRKDRLNELWRRFGWIVWLLAAAIVGYTIWNEWNTARQAELRETRMAQLEAALGALEDGRYVVAQEGLDELVATGSALSPLAAHYLAQARIEGSGDVEGAIAALEAVADAEGEPFEQLALLKSVYLRSERLTLAEMEAELAPLVALDSQIGALAEEAIAAKAYADGDLARARQAFGRLRFNAAAPASLVQRATIAYESIPRTGAEAVEATPADTPPASDPDVEDPQ